MSKQVQDEQIFDEKEIQKQDFLQENVDESKFLQDSKQEQSQEKSQHDIIVDQKKVDLQLQATNSQTNKNVQNDLVPKPVQEEYSKLRNKIEDIHSKINKLVKQSEDEFIYAYKKQITQLQRELKALKKRMDEETLKLKANDKINILEEERDYFRQEALRLDEICKQQQRDIDELKFKMKILQEDKTYYEGFVIETKKENKALQSELLYIYKHKLGKNQIPPRKENNSQISKENKSSNFQQTQQINPLSPQQIIFNEELQASNQGSEQDNIPEFDQQLNSNNNNNNNNNNYFQCEQISNDEQEQRNIFPTGINVQNEPNNQRASTQQQWHRQNSNETSTAYVQKLKREYMQQVETAKSYRLQLEKEKQAHQKLKSELITNNIQRSDLEQVLLDCINEAKKDIQKRKLLNNNNLSSLPTDKGNNLSIKTSLSPMNINFNLSQDTEVQQNQLNHQDKIKLLKNFITSDKFLDQLYQLTFNRVNSSTTRPPTSMATPSVNHRLTESWKQDLNEVNQIYEKFKGFRYTFSAKNFGRKNALKQDLASSHFKFTKDSRNKINKILEL